MKTIWLAALSLLCGKGMAQLAKLTSSGQQEYRMNVKRGFAFVTPFSKAIRSYSVADMIDDSAGGYLKFNVLKGESGSTKDAAYVHFLRLDRRLITKSEKEVYLVGEGSANALPIGAYVADQTLNLITALPGKTEGTLSLRGWEFGLKDLDLRKGNIELATIPLDGTKEYDFRLYAFKNKAGFAMTVLEQGGKKENPILHCLQFDGRFSLQGKRSHTLPYLPNKGSIVSTLTDADRAVYCLLSYPDKKEEEVSVNELLVFTADGSRSVPLQHNGQPIINAAIGLSTNGGLLLGGMVWPGKKEYCNGFITATFTSAKGLMVTREEAFSPSLLKLLTEADDKKGVKADYRIRSISQRSNGITDVVMNYCRQYAGGSNYFTTDIFDLIVFSFDNTRLVSTLPLKRNIYQTTQRISNIVNTQTFSVPQVFTVNDALYLMYFDNQENEWNTGTDKKPKWADFSNARLVLARIDKSFKPTQQEIIQFEKGGEFRNLFEMRSTALGEKQFMLTTNQYAVFSKNVKTSSILVDIR